MGALELLQPPARWTKALKQLPALSIRQPFAWYVAYGFKDVENRSWRTHFRGRVLIHAAQNLAELHFGSVRWCERHAGIRLPDDYDYPTGGIIGVAELVDCVRTHASPWKRRGTWGWVLANARPLLFRKCKGALGFFRPRL